MSKSAFIRIILAGIVILASASTYSQTIECDGTVVSGSGNFSSAAPCSPLRYMYKIDDTSFAVPETVYIGTHDNVMANYTNVCISTGWTFDIVSTPQDDYNGSTPHANISPGPDGTCPFNIVLISGAGASVPLYFGFDHPDRPHDVGWKIITHVWVSSNWSEPVGDGLGPVHAPRCDSVLIGGDIDGNGVILAIPDLIYLDKFVRGLGPAPIPLWAGDLNADGYIDALDVILLKQYFIFGLSAFPQYPILVSCDPDTVRGACCIGDTCLVLSQFNCEDTTGVYFDNASLCENYVCPNSILGVKFEDINCNGIRDAGEPVIPGWPIYVYEGTTLIASTTTDANGEYKFMGLPAGILRVREDVLPGWVQTVPPTVLYRIDLVDGDILYDFDFGNTRDTCIEPSQVSSVVQEAGTRDNFVGPELSYADLAVDLNGVLGCNGINLYFDSLQQNECFAHTFVNYMDSNCCVIGGQLCLRIKGSTGDTKTDALGIAENGSIAWLISLNTLQAFATGGADLIWNSGETMDICLDLENMPPDYFGTTNVLAALQDNDFSIYIGDDTEVDFLELTVELCCGPKYCIIFDTECCDGKPIIAQRENPPNFRGQVAVASCYSNPLGASPYPVGILDLTDECDAPRGTPAGFEHGFEPAMFHNEMPNFTNKATDVWNMDNLGSVFGLALDNNGNIYAAATSCYINDVSPYGKTGGQIFQLSGTTGEVKLFGSLPCDSQGIGNIAYDCLNNQLFASNMDDGMIYSIRDVGPTPSSGPIYDHGMDGRFNVGLSQIPDLTSFSYSLPGRRIWGLAVAQGTESGGGLYYRLFYSVYWEDQGHPDPDEQNEIWSVGLDPSNGDFMPATAKLEFKVPSYKATNYSNPVSDITFKANGRIILAERSMVGPDSPSAHKARVLEFACENGEWVRQLNTDMPPVDIFQIPADDNLNPNPSSAGGVDIDFRADYDSLCEGQLWATADALRWDDPPNIKIYGMAGFPQTGGTTEILVGNAILIDFDGNFTSSAKWEIGDVEIPCKCCNGNRGDINGDGTDSNILDLTYCVDYIFRGGRRAPCPQESDINSDFNTLNILDLTFIVDFIFRGGQAAGPCD